ncbi:alpha-(1,3)-fucosyltransferase C-like [Aricia agestis]|uniref:alpha-(1,3)-fucosyltransferase C-like n=1 Tax=Aricia agestis TaxID=91739 RepID=UPI001C2089CC|nr:alpha-(1,3)-fucosyltransferase C-like [Aricia agestis]
MPKIFKTIIFAGSCALLVYLLKSEFLDSDEEIELKYLLRTPGTLKKIRKEIRSTRNVSAAQKYTRPRRLPNDYKYILKWTQAFSHFDSPMFRNGQKVFLDHNCTFKNCYMTNDKSLLVDLRHFDAIIFDAENTWDAHPPLTFPHQMRIFASIDSATNDPVCDEYYDDFFHLTWTYKLDSNISSPFIRIQDKNNNVIGPRINMPWVSPMEPTGEDVIAKLNDKENAVAWFVTDCHLMRRMTVVKDLVKSLKKHNLKLDIYGPCGNLTCPRNRMEECLGILQRKYYFYLAFEDSNSEDYVTDKILYPLLHYTVPIVFGGADYSRFLPPGSYVDAGKLKSDQVVDLMVEAMRAPAVYRDYFRWRKYYVYKESPGGADVCKLCELLDEPNFGTRNNFRRWWNSNYENVCKIPFIRNSQFKF